jgi:response regulator RpfG family c-di-GMP phosphodiesterase
LTSDRPYRPAVSDEEALRILSARRGTLYDPLIVDSFAAPFGFQRADDLLNPPRDVDLDARD